MCGKIHSLKNKMELGFLFSWNWETNRRFLRGGRIRYWKVGRFDEEFDRRRFPINLSNISMTFWWPSKLRATRFPSLFLPRSYFTYFLDQDCQEIVAVAKCECAFDRNWTRRWVGGSANQCWSWKYVQHEHGRKREKKRGAWSMSLKVESKILRLHRSKSIWWIWDMIGNCVGSIEQHFSRTILHWMLSWQRYLKPTSLRNR
jgi:hypothetical protein